MKYSSHKPGVILLCGLPGSGKTWVSSQLKHKYVVLEHEHQPYNELLTHVTNLVNTQPRTVLVTCPFGEGRLRNDLESLGMVVHPYFIIEAIGTVIARYEARSRAMLGKQFIARAHTILDTVKKWNVPYGTSSEVLKLLEAYE